MSNNVIKLSRNEFYNMVMEGVKKALNEIGDTPQGLSALAAVQGRAAARMQNHDANYDKYRQTFDDSDDAISKARNQQYSKTRDMYPLADAENKGYLYGYKKGNGQLEEAVKKSLRKVLIKEGFFDSFQLPEKKSEENVDNNTNKNGGAQKRKRVISRLKADGVDVAQYAYRLWPDKDEDSARSYFYKCLNGEENDDGVPYNFDDSEINRLYSLLSNNEL